MLRSPFNHLKLFLINANVFAISILTDKQLLLKLWILKSSFRNSLLG